MIIAGICMAAHQIRHRDEIRIRANDRLIENGNAQQEKLDEI